MLGVAGVGIKRVVDKWKKWWKLKTLRPDHWLLFNIPMKKQWRSLKFGKGLLGNKATIIISFFFLWGWRRTTFMNSAGRDTNPRLVIAGYLTFYLKTCTWKIVSWQPGINMRKTQRERLCSSRAWFIEGQLTKTNSCSPVFHNINTK